MGKAVVSTRFDSNARKPDGAQILSRNPTEFAEGVVEVLRDTPFEPLGRLRRTTAKGSTGRLSRKLNAL